MNTELQETEAVNEYSAGVIDESMLTEEERQKVDLISASIDISNAEQVMQYGLAAQKVIADFSVNVFNKVNTKDLGDVGASLEELTVFLESTEVPEKKGFMGLFKKEKKGIDTVKANYAKAETNVKKIEKTLQNHQVTLAQDISLYRQMQELNYKNCNELTMYIIAGKKALDKATSVTIVELMQKADISGRQEDLERHRKFEGECLRFEKRLHDMELSRVISLQMAPQLQLLQNNDRALLEKIQLSLNSTIPLWRNQVVIRLGLENTKRAIEAQNNVVDIETLNQSNRELISSILEVVKIYEDGTKQRIAAEQEIQETIAGRSL